MIELERRNEQAVIFQAKDGRILFTSFGTSLDGERIVKELESQELHVIDVTSLQDAIKFSQTERWEESSTPSNPNIRKF